MQRRIMLKGLAGAPLAGALLTIPFSASSAAAQGGVNIPINFTSALGSFLGNFNVTQFAVQNGQLVAIGTLTGTVKDALGNVLGTINQALTLPVNLTQSSGSCQILDLVLGPLHLDLLGLVIDLNQVHLTITAQSGSGKLLGNLLCAVAHLLDNNGPLHGLAALLNQILGQL